MSKNKFIIPVLYIRYLQLSTQCLVNFSVFYLIIILYYYTQKHLTQHYAFIYSEVFVKNILVGVKRCLVIFDCLDVLYVRFLYVCRVPRDISLYTLIYIPNGGKKTLVTYNITGTQLKIIKNVSLKRVVCTSRSLLISILLSLTFCLRKCLNFQLLNFP